MRNRLGADVHPDVLVVIGTGGMGLAIARRLGSGDVTVLADIDQAQLKSAADSLTGTGHTVATQRVDVTSRESVRELARYAADAGRVTRVVHTAGVSPEMTSRETLLAVDLVGVALVLDEFGKTIAPGGAGVVIASMAGHVNPPLAPEVERQLATVAAEDLLDLPACSADAIANSHMAYPFAKRANQIRVAAAAAQWAQRKARINSISPGVIATDMGHRELAGQTGAIAQAMLNASSAGRIGSPDEIAAATEFLLSKAASFITGTDLLVDGGAIAALRTGDVFGT